MRKKRAAFSPVTAEIFCSRPRSEPQAPVPLRGTIALTEGAEKPKTNLSAVESTVKARKSFTPHRCREV